MCTSHNYKRCNVLTLALVVNNIFPTIKKKKLFVHVECRPIECYYYLIQTVQNKLIYNAIEIVLLKEKNNVKMLTILTMQSNHILYVLR